MGLHRIYVWTDIALITEGEYRCSDSPALLIPIKGKASWRLNGQASENMMADVYVLPSHTAMNIENASGNPWSAFLISFKSVVITDHEYQQEVDRLTIDCVQELYTSSFNQMVRLAEQLYQGRHATEEPEAYRMHAMFQEMLHLLLAAVHTSDESQEERAIQAVKRSIA
ncbi:hypothetical protein [Brevibacillus reuszeri]|uniref:hypothetical protein n=1 Tax=Brevibacillus reuszeri TaxID=54915 RepID=UPI003D1FDDF6